MAGRVIHISEEEAARDFAGIKTFEIIVDNCCMQMVTRPQKFDVMVMGNLYGDLVSDLAAGLVGGISATAGINIGENVRVYDAFHGGPRETVGIDRANPLPLLLPAIDLLKSVGMMTPADRILNAIETALTERHMRTADLGGTATTTQMTDAIIASLA